MVSEIKSYIIHADAEGRYLSPGELERIKAFLQSGPMCVHLSKTLTGARESIVKQAGDLLFQVRPDIVSPGGNAYGEKMTATCLRDLDYYLRLVTYGIITGHVAPIEEFGIVGVREIYNSLGTPISAVAEGIFAMKIVSASLLSEEEVAEANVYFDYLINALDGVSYASSRTMERIFAQRKKSLVQSSSLEREPWEPKNYQEWLDFDRLSQQLKKNGVEDEAYFERTAISFFESWSRMPSQMKKEIWRDREIIAALYEQIDSWKNIPGFLSVGVAKRTVNAEDRKAGILTFAGISGRIIENLYEIAKIPRFLKIESSIYEYLDEEQQLVPIILEWMEPPREYSSSENLMLASGTDLLPAPSALAVQSGDVIFGRNSGGRYNESQAVTLTAFAVSDDRLTNLGLSVWHGFKAGYEEVYSCEENNDYAKVGQILFDNTHQKKQAKKLDVALIKIESACQINSHLKWVNKPPQKPDLPIPDLIVQMHGGVSGHQKGFINQGMMLFPGIASSTIPYFTATILSQPGDSGSLLVFGHDSVCPVSDSLSKYMDKSSLEARMLAMLGMLVEGSERGTNGSVAIFRPMLDIFAYLNLQPSL